MNRHKTGITVCGHGTRSAEGLTSFFNVYHTLETQLLAQGYAINFGFIEQSEPLLSEALNEHLEKGITEMVIVPLLLFSGVHTTHDIPYIVKTTLERHPGVSIRVSEPLGLSHLVVEMCIKSVENAVNESGLGYSQCELLVVGVGSSKPEANIKIATLTRVVWENLPFSYVSYSFISKMAYPDIDLALERLKASGAKNIVILPVLLFPGVYLNNIVLKAELFKKGFGGKVPVCKTFDQSPQLSAAFVDKIQQAFTHEANLQGEAPSEPRKPTKHD